MPQHVSISGADVLMTTGHAIETNSFRVDRFPGKARRTATLEPITNQLLLRADQSQMKKASMRWTIDRGDIFPLVADRLGELCNQALVNKEHGIADLKWIRRYLSNEDKRGRFSEYLPDDLDTSPDLSLSPAL
jgi:hypothetical protein